MKKVYNSPELIMVELKAKPVCGITGSQTTIDKEHSVDASSSLSREGRGSVWDDDEE